MSIFNKEYVHCMADKALYGKYGYFADSVDTLESYVINDYLRYWGKLGSKPSSNRSLPFINEDDECMYKFFYHDPKWNRVAPHYNRRATNRELALWLAQGNGEACYFNKVTPTACFTEFRYHPDYADDLVSTRRTSRLMVRRWHDIKWNAPTIDYLGLEE